MDVQGLGVLPATLLVARTGPRRGPFLQLAIRGGLAVGLLLLVALTVWLGREGYVDDRGTPVTFLSALYYASVSVTTTGYGDITPVTDGARLATVLIVTPARIGFLLLLLGTTIELLTERWRDEYRRRRWRDDVDDHYVICGYGVKGRAAARALRDDGVPLTDIVIIEPSAGAAGEATRDGYTVVVGDATRTATLREAHVERARAVLVATDRDDSAVLTTLTAKQLAPRASIVAAVREDENRHLLEQSGATSVVTSSETAGRLLGVTSRHPDAARVVEDLLDTAHGLMLVERRVGEMELGKDAGVTEGQVPVAVLRAGRLIRIDETDSTPLREGDLLISLAGVANGGRGATRR
jgi:voltage-gated potassium channel